MRRPPALILPGVALFLATLAIGIAGAQPVPPVGGPLRPAGLPELPPPPPVQAVRVTTPIDIDGALTEAVWKEAPACTTFHQVDPLEWAPPSQRTEVRVAYDDDALYVGARMFDTAPDSIIVRLARRDVGVQSDQFTVFLDSQRDGRSGYYFSVNVAGTLYDGTLSNDGAQDGSWDGVWQGRARRDEQGWTVEMRIPLSQLRYVGGAQPVWGINFFRMLQRRNETNYVVHQPKNGSGFVSRFPELQGLRDLRATHAIELLPYVTSKAEYLVHSPDDPFNDGSRYSGNAGGDLRTSVGSRLTLNATVNPDFGQVEVDPAVVNLSDIETYFQEKRPFFVENNAVFHFGNEGANSYWNFNWNDPQFFYSRRIGRAPEGSVPDSEFTHTPTATTILGAAKLTGKLGPDWNFGTLHALTGREYADLSGSGIKSSTEIEPLTYYGIARGLRQFSGRRYGFGMMGSLVARDFDEPTLRDQLNAQSVVGAIDGWAFLDPRKIWVLSGWSAMTWAHGTQARILSLQQNSQHYLQRPDAGYLHPDSAATSMTGFGTRLWLNKQEGHTFMNAGFGFLNPRFDVNDMGFMRFADEINAHVAGGYKWTQPTRLTKYQDFSTALFGSTDFGGQVTWAGYFLNGNTTFINNYTANYEFAYNPQTVNDRATRGGPRILNLPGYEFSLYADTDGKRPVYLSVNAYTYFQPEANSWQWNVFPSIELKPVSNLLFSMGPGYERSFDTSAWVDNYVDATATGTYGSRYVFADLDQTTVSGNFRVNWAFTPSVSFQLYAQPLVSTGNYQNYKELARPRSYDFLTYGENGSSFDPSTTTADPDGAGPAPPIAIGDRDFTVRSLRGNAVFRWEYMPGSTFYLVWTQTRDDQVTEGEFNFRQSMSALGNTHPDNIFLAKLSYYFAP